MTSEKTDLKCFKPRYYERDHFTEIFCTQTFFRNFVIGFVLCNFSCVVGFVTVFTFN